MAGPPRSTSGRYGASIWCDPEAWIPEAARLLRPGGRLWFLVNTPLLLLTMHDEDEPSGEALALGATSRHSYVTAEWARRWPSEEIWVARLDEERASVVA